MDTVIIAAGILLGVVGLVLLIDVAAVWRRGGRSLDRPERVQLVTGIAVVAFSAAFFLAQLGGEPAPAAPIATPAPSPATGAEQSLTRLAATAKLPDLAARPQREPPEKPERPSRKPKPGPGPDTQTTATTTTTPTTTTSTPTTTTPAPTTSTPAPEPAPQDPDVPFDSRE
jgi:hypothetical protein